MALRTGSFEAAGVRRPDARKSVPPETEDKYLTSAIIRKATEGLSSTHPSAKW